MPHIKLAFTLWQSKGLNYCRLKLQLHAYRRYLPLPLLGADQDETGFNGKIILWPENWSVGPTASDGPERDQDSRYKDQGRTSMQDFTKIFHIQTHT